MKRILILVLLLVVMMGTGALAEKKKMVKITTNLGVITLELYPEKAPNSVKNFLRYAEEGYYSGTIFHRVIDGFMIQGGGYGEKFDKKETHEPIKNEADNGLKNVRGTIAYARTMDPHSATSQFFINVANNDFLDFTAQTPRGWGYAVFGKVVEGMKIVDQIAKIPTGAFGPFPQDVPMKPVIIESVTVVKK